MGETFGGEDIMTEEDFRTLGAIIGIAGLLFFVLVVMPLSFIGGVAWIVKWVFF